MKQDRVYLFDTMLRDGAQTQGITLSVTDKSDIAMLLDKLGLDYVEGGWPGANPTDDKFFANPPGLKTSKLVAFGMTRRVNTSAGNDPGLNALINTGVSVVCIVGKAWDFQVTNALEIPLDENIKMIGESVAYLNSKTLEVSFDAEHFFDGFKANPEYALKAAKAAFDAGARWVVLCDTNGGTLPHEITDIVAQITKHIPGASLGIHCHNDTENAVANSIAAVRAGVRQVQGTLGGYGERCGNANLIALIPTLSIKMGYDVGISKQAMRELTPINKALDEILHRVHYRHAPYVGDAAFAHKGGLHVSAVIKNPASYEHIDPALVGNNRVILTSDQGGRSNILRRVEDIGLKIDPKDPKVKGLVEEIKKREHLGYAYDMADASFEILAKQRLGVVPEFFKLKSFRVLNETQMNGNEPLVSAQAVVKLSVGGRQVLTAAEGNGPVNALNTALKKALVRKYPQLKDIKLKDYKVRIISPEHGTGAVTRVFIETGDSKGERWFTVGVSSNILEASYEALKDAIIYRLLHS